MFDKNTIRELLIDSVHSKNQAKDFFNSKLTNKELLDVLVEIAIDDYSGDARMEASYWSSKFEPELLKNIEGQLLKIQSDELDNIACHAFVALARIKSKDGLRYIIDKRIEPEMYWESEALKLYMEDFLK